MSRYLSNFHLKALTLSLLPLLIHSTHAETVSISQKLDLGSFLSDNKGQSVANAINGYGDMVVGTAAANVHTGTSTRTESIAITWRNPAYQNKRMLPDGISGDHAGIVSAISRSGDVAVGSAWFPNTSDPLFEKIHASAVWRGGNAGFGNPIQLPGLNPDAVLTTNTIASAISADGRVVGGNAYDKDAGRFLPAIWSGPSYGSLTTLPTIGTPTNATVTALNGTGSIAIGNLIHSLTDTNGVVWHGNGRRQITSLKTLHSNNAGSSEAADISENGSIIVGASNNNNNIAQPTVWQGINWSTASGLSMPSGHQGRATTISGDGKVIGGVTYHASSPIPLPTQPNQNTAIIWFGDNYKDSQQLGTLKQDNTGASYIADLNYDGTVAVGFADTDDTNVHGDTHAMLVYTVWWMAAIGLNIANNSTTLLLSLAMIGLALPGATNYSTAFVSTKFPRAAYIKALGIVHPVQSVVRCCAFSILAFGLAAFGGYTGAYMLLIAIGAITLVLIWLTNLTPVQE